MVAASFNFSGCAPKKALNVLKMSAVAKALSLGAYRTKLLYFSTV